MTHHFRFIPVKCNGKNFQKLQKTTFWGTFLVSFEPIRIFLKIPPCQFLTLIKSYIHAKNQKKTSEVFLKEKKELTEGQKHS